MDSSSGRISSGRGSFQVDGTFSGRAARKMTHEKSLVKRHRDHMATARDSMSKLGLLAVSARPPPNISLEDGTWQSCVGKVLYSIWMEVVFAVIITFNLVVIIVDTDSRAATGETAPWITVSSLLCFSIFVAEFAARVFVERRTLLCNSWNRMDFVIVVTGVTELIVQRLFTQYSSLSMFRIARLLRLAKVLKMLTSLPELHKLMEMMVTCMRTLFWSFILMFLLMTTWSIVMVELVSPLVKDVVDNRDDLITWSLAYSTVMRSNLTLFRTIVAGDGWGRLAVPIIEVHPWTIVLFVPGFLVLVFGVLNLIVAVVVDTAAEARQNNDKTQASARVQEERLEKAALLGIFESIDKDNCASVSYEELKAGMENVPEFRNKLRSMDVGAGDLRQLFAVLDENGSGDVDSEEFIETLSRMRSTDSRTAVMLIKHYVMDLMKRQQQFDISMADLKESVDASFKVLCHEGACRRSDAEQVRAIWGHEAPVPPTSPEVMEEDDNIAVSCQRSEIEAETRMPGASARNAGQLSDGGPGMSALLGVVSQAPRPRTLVTL